MSDPFSLITTALSQSLSGIGVYILLGLSAAALFLAGRGPRRRWHRNPNDGNLSADDPPFRAYPVLNAAERRLQSEIERVLPDVFHPRARLLAQVSLPEFVYAKTKSDFHTISGSRVDYLIVDSSFRPICAIEYQGAGHNGPTAHSRARTRTRDFNKRRALRMAGVPLVEIPEQYDTALVRDRLSDVTGRRDMPDAAPRREHKGRIRA